MTSYELDFLSDYASVVKFKIQKVWSRSVDICGDGKEKNLERWIPPPPPPLPAEIGLTVIFQKWWRYNLQLHPFYFSFKTIFHLFFL